VALIANHRPCRELKRLARARPFQQVVVGYRGEAQASDHPPDAGEEVALGKAPNRSCVD